MPRLLIALCLALACGSNPPAPPPPPDAGPPAPAPLVLAPPVAPPALEAWPNGSVFYEVFVRSFQDSNGDGKGDLQGLISRLDYLNDGDPSTTTDLGVDAIWLMPIFSSPSYHGYDVTDYEQINPDYGTSADFDALIAAAHKRGIKVILDLVLNHTGSGHPWFVDSASSPSSAHRDWYVWSATDLGWDPPFGGGDTWHPQNGAWFYGLFGGGMPDLNYNTPAVHDAVKGIAGYWLGRGADGFRLDAARYLYENGEGGGQQDQPQTHAFWKEFSAYVRSVSPSATLVGEAWADPATIAAYYGDTTALAGGDELPLAFDFPLAGAIVDSARSGSATELINTIQAVQGAYPAGATDVPFLTNHDMVRAASAMGNDAGAMASAVAVLLTLPGTPFLYYGEEVGLREGNQNGDLGKRTPMPWSDDGIGGGFTTASPWTPFAPGRTTANVKAQQGDPASLWSRYRALIDARHRSGALARGGFQLLTAPDGVVAFLRATTVETVLVAHNLGSAQVTAGPFAAPGTKAVSLFSDAGATLSSGASGWTATLGPRASGAWRLQ
ncbi:MAG TPA: alpha-amylase family glycosyl hydrolase [Myxococcales bacterium]|nr:alpha-amylase family glycosyl hydrolase [Myxococcales bacterium]